MSVENFPESLSQAMLVGVMLVGGLGVMWLSGLVHASLDRNVLRTSYLVLNPKPKP